MLGTEGFSAGGPKDMAMILRVGKSRPSDVNQFLTWYSVRKEGWMEWATTVRMRSALCGPMLVRKDALYVGLKPTGPRKVVSMLVPLTCAEILGHTKKETIVPIEDCYSFKVYR